MSNREPERTYGLIENPLNKKLIDQLNRQGKEVLVLPPVTVEGIELSAENEKLIKNLLDFDWIIFTDIFTADYFIEALRKLDVDFFDLDHLKVCAFGESVADRLRFVQVHADVIPSQMDDDSIFSAIERYSEEDVSGLKFLILTDASDNAKIVNNLSAAGAQYKVIPIYRTNLKADAGIIKLKTLVKGGAVDEFIFSSAEDFASFRKLFKDENPASILSGMQVSVLNETAYQLLNEHGLRPLYFHPK